MDKRPRSSGHSRHSYGPKAARHEWEEEETFFEDDNFTDIFDANAQNFLKQAKPKYALVPYEPARKDQLAHNIQPFSDINYERSIRESIEQSLHPWQGELKTPALGEGGFGIVFKFDLKDGIPCATVLKLERAVYESIYRRSFQFKAEVEKYRSLHLSLEELYLGPDDIEKDYTLTTEEMQKFVEEKGISEVPAGTLLAFRNQINCLKFLRREPGFARISGSLLQGFSQSLESYLDDNFSDFYTKPREYAQMFKDSFRQVSVGLEYIHRQGYAHTDLKDGNICCEGAGKSTRFYLIDFGLVDKLPETRREKPILLERSVQSVYESSAVRQKLELLNAPADELESLLYMRLLDFFSLVRGIDYTPFPWYPPRDWPIRSDFEYIDTRRIDKHLKSFLARDTDDALDPAERAPLKHKLEIIASQIWENYIACLDECGLSDSEASTAKIDFQLELGWVPALLVEIWSVSMERFDTLPDYNFIRSFIPY